MSDLEDVEESKGEEMTNGWRNAVCNTIARGIGGCTTPEGLSRKCCVVVKRKKDWCETCKAWNAVHLVDAALSRLSALKRKAKR